MRIIASWASSLFEHTILLKCVTHYVSYADGSGFIAMRFGEVDLKPLFNSRDFRSGGNHGVFWVETLW
jgi:hypothetical protein